MKIPEGAVTKAAKAIAGKYWQTAVDDARAALEAAAPSLMATVWDEGCLHGSAYPYGKHGLTVDDNPYRKEQP